MCPDNSFWEASKAVASLIRADLRALVKLRNDSARNLAFKNYHDLQLYLNEQMPEQILKLFDQLDELTRDPFHKAKAEIDEKLAARYGVQKEELMPWHYHDPFFQEPPAVFAASDAGVERHGTSGVVAPLPQDAP